MLNPVSLNSIYLTNKADNGSKTLIKLITPGTASNFQNKNETNNKFISFYHPFKNNIVSFAANTADTINKVLILSKYGETPLIKRPDGGYLVDTGTNTVIYYGIEAKKFLKDASYFKHDTEIICQSDCKIKMESANGEKVSLSEPGAVLINGGTFATVKSIQGNPLVITSEKRPEWYTKMSPVNEHKLFFENLVEKNKHIYAGHIASALVTEEKKHLITAGIVKEIDDNYIEFIDIKDISDLSKKLQHSTLNVEQQEKIVSIWQQVQDRLNAVFQNPGEVFLSDFQESTKKTDIFLKLQKAGIIKINEKNKTIWNKFWG